jgi:hypothetical protein
MERQRNSGRVRRIVKGDQGFRVVSIATLFRLIIVDNHGIQTKDNYLLLNNMKALSFVLFLTHKAVLHILNFQKGKFYKRPSKNNRFFL